MLVTLWSPSMNLIGHSVNRELPFKSKRTLNTWISCVPFLLAIFEIVVTFVISLKIFWVIHIQMLNRILLLKIIILVEVIYLAHIIGIIHFREIPRLSEISLEYMMIMVSTCDNNCRFSAFLTSTDENADTKNQRHPS